MKSLKYILFLLLLLGSYIISKSKDYRYGIDFDYNHRIEVEADTSINNRILQVWSTSTELNVKIQVSDKNKTINITVYNMLGKEIVKVFDGPHVRENDPYTVNINMPNGIYICVLTGDGFKHAEKFIISR